MRTLIVNFKNYHQASGESAIELARVVAASAEGKGVEAIVCPPLPMLGSVASRIKIKVFSQTVGYESGDMTTGAVTVDSVRLAGAGGTLLNHSECRTPFSKLKELLPRLRESALEVCLCAKDSAEAARLSKLGPDYLAVEPPELIGSGIAVSKARPEVVSNTVKAARSAGYGGKILCGAGIVTGEDVKKALELGADGVLVASSVVKAQDWKERLSELTGSLI